MTYADTLETLAASSEGALGDLYDRYEAGDVTAEQFVALATAVAVRVNARSAVFADVALAADLTARTGSAVPALGLFPDPGDADRLDGALRTLLDDERVTRDRVTRLARNEPLSTAAEARHDGIARSVHTEGWTRQTNTKPCPMCIRLTGPVLPKTARMARHTGCSCVQIPAVRTTTTRRRRR